MTQTVLHFVFTPSGSGCLVQALRKAGRDDQVVVSFDDLSCGPIDPGDRSSRAKWAENELGRPDWSDIPAKSDRDWGEARFPDNRKVAWLTRRSAMEYAGFLDWLWRLGDAPCEVVDLSEVEITYRPEHGPPRPPALALSLGMLHPDTICREKLWDLAEPLQDVTRERYRNLWQQLLSENAPLRVIDGDNLASAPISFFDSMLMSHMTDDWQRVARVVGEALVFGMEDCIIGPGDLLFRARIKALAESGRVEIQGGSALEMFVSQVRLASKNRSRGDEQ